MSSIKPKTKTAVNKRTMLNTTIKDDVLDNFKSYCKEIGMPMNMILEAFMLQFSNGEFILKIGKSNKLNVDLEDNIKDNDMEEVDNVNDIK